LVTRFADGRARQQPDVDLSDRRARATARPCAYADGVSLIDMIVLPVTTIRS
jgi:hypothetical protein